MVSPGRAHQPLGGARRQPPERDLDLLRAGPHAGKDVVDLRARQREHHERSGRQRAQPLAEVRHAWQVSPVQVLEHHEERPRRALGGQPFAERPPQPFGHDARIVARGAKLRARTLRRGDAEELSEEVGDALEVPVPADLGDVRPELRVLLGGGIALAKPDGVAHELPHHHERRPRAHRIRASHEDRDVARARGPSPRTRAAAATCPGPPGRSRARPARPTRRRTRARWPRAARAPCPCPRRAWACRAACAGLRRRFSGRRGRWLLPSARTSKRSPRRPDGHLVDADARATSNAPAAPRPDRSPARRPSRRWSAPARGQRDASRRKRVAQLEGARRRGDHLLAGAPAPLRRDEQRAVGQRATWSPP